MNPEPTPTESPRQAPASGLALLLPELSPAVAEPRAYAELHGLGITGDAVTGPDPLDALHFEAVIPIEPGRFVFARDQLDQRGAVTAFLFAARDEHGELIDMAAWISAEPLARLLHGHVAALGLEQLFAPRIDAPLFVQETVLDWLRADREGLVILDAARAAALLDGVTLAASTVASARRVKARLAPFIGRPPRVLVPERAANG